MKWNGLNVDIRLNTEATIEEIQVFRSICGYLATGGQPFIPNIEGKELNKCVSL